VFRINGGRAQLTRVEIGHQNQGQAEIVAGLSAGDHVVLYPDRSLSDNQPVRRRLN
jgi:HlyD family secretion protein